MERPFFPTKIKARRELARFGLISKDHYRPQMIQFDVLDDPRWQGRFRIDRYRPFAFQDGSMVYNSRDHNCIHNATDNPWAYCPGNDSEHEYQVIHTLGWTLQLTNITLTFDVASEHMYYGKICIKSDLDNTCHTCILVVCKNTFMMKMHFHVLRFSRNLSKNVMKTAHIMPLNNKTFLYNTKKVLILSPGNPTLITHT